jgi:hypothetical protein
MTARDTVQSMLTAYLVSMLTVAWLAAMAGGLRVLGWLWAPIIADVLVWIERWGGLMMVAFLVFACVCLAFMGMVPLLAGAAALLRMGRSST